MAAIGASAIIGWLFSLPRLPDWDGDGISMQFNAAVCSLCAGVALLLGHVGRSGVARMLGAFVAVVGAATLAEHLTGLNFGIDTILFTPTFGQRATAALGRMGIPTCLCVMLLGSAIALAFPRNLAGPGRRWAAVLGTIAGALTSLSLIGYAYGADLMYATPQLTAIAMQTAVTWLSLAIAVVMGMPERQPVRALLENNAAGMLARRAMPVLVLGPLVLGWIGVKGQQLGWYDTAFGTAALVVSLLWLFLALLWWAVASLSRHEAALRHAREAQRRGEEKYRAAFEVASVGQVQVDAATGRFTMVNDAFCRITGRSRDELMRLTPLDLDHLDERAVDQPHLMALLSGRQGTYSAEKRYKQPDGNVVWVRVNATLVRDEGGAPLHTVAVVEDITERKRTEEQLRESEERQRLIANTIPQLAWMARGDGWIFWYNQRWYEYTGMTPEQMEGWGWQRVHDPVELRRVEVGWRAALASGAPWEDTFPLRRHDGEMRWHLSRAMPLKDASGRVLFWFGTNTDVTEQRRIEEELRLHREQLERLVQDRTAQLEASYQRLQSSERMAAIGTLAAGLGHDMGNLLMPLRMRLDTLEAAGLPPAAREDVAAVRACAEYLRKLSSGLRLLSQDPWHGGDGEPTHVRTWWDEVEPMLRNAMPRGAEFRSDLEGCEGVHVGISRPALTQVVFNLVQNAADAIKEMQEGTVTVAVRCEGGRARFTVADTGPGMSEEVQRRCMEPFYTTKPRSVSTGLGLSLVYGLVREAGGLVELRSEPGRGTTFVINLPMYDGRRAAPTGAARRAIVRIRDPRVRGYVVSELRGMNFHVEQDSPDAQPEDLVVQDAGAQQGPGHVLVLDDRPKLSEVRVLLRGAAEALARNGR